MTCWSENRGILCLRSLIYHPLSWIVTVLYLLMLPALWAPRRIAWPILRSYISVQLWLLRVICGQSFRIIHSAPLPDGPVIFAARHEAMWETMVLPIVLNDPIVFLKQEILAYPVAGAVARKLDYIGLDRAGDLDKLRQAFGIAKHRAAEGRSFLIFPNGTRNPKHRTRVQTGIAVLYRALNLPVVPVTLDSGKFWPYQSWLRRPGTITIRTLPVIPNGLRSAEFMTQLEKDLKTDA